MQTDHDKIVSKIQKKMAGAYMKKSEEQKKQEIFQYGRSNQQQNSNQNDSTLMPNKKSIVSPSQAERNLGQIYNFYVNTYIQPRKHIETFDVVNERRLTLQPFILFTKNFRLLKLIFPINKIKVFFKKYSNFGQFLTLENFIFLINQLSHQPQAKNFFNINQNPQQSQFNLESLQQVQKQELYNYLNLQNPIRFRQNFKNVFEPFFCKTKIQSDKIKFIYRKFSQPELLKKSLPHNQNKTQQKQLYVIKNKDNQRETQVQQSLNPFNQAKSIVVSWESFRSKSLAHLQKNSEEIVKKKYVNQDPADDLFLRQYQEKQDDQRKRIEQKIKQITKQQSYKNKILLAKLQQKTSPKSLVIKRPK